MAGNLLVARRSVRQGNMQPLSCPLAAILGLAVCGMAAAQPPAGDGRDIVVTGTPDRRAAGTFVETVTVETQGQVARFDAPGAASV
jgi:hypothetical protein